MQKELRITHENAENKGLSLVEAEMGRLMRQDKEELLSVWEGWNWDDIRRRVARLGAVCQGKT